MASVRQAVLEFDAAVQVPWRPLLGSDDGGRPDGAGRTTRAAAPAGRAARPVAAPRPAGTGPRVAGHLRPVPDRPAGPEPRVAESSPSARGAGRAPARRDEGAVGDRPAAGAGWCSLWRSAVSWRSARWSRRSSAAGTAVG